MIGAFRRWAGGDNLGGAVHANISSEIRASLISPKNINQFNSLQDPRSMLRGNVNNADVRSSTLFSGVRNASR